MQLWMIPSAYTMVAVVAALSVPRLEHHVLKWEWASLSVSSVLAFYSAVASGMMALTGVVFAVAFVLVQFSAVAYSPRLVGIVSGSTTIFHTMGLFFATFTYAIFAMAWVDRERQGGVPAVSAFIVGALLVASMMAFALLVQSLSDLRVNNVLQFIGGRGRTVIRGMFPKVGSDDARLAPLPPLPPAIQTVTYEGEPCVVTHFDIPALVRLAQAGNAVIVAECAVGDTLVDIAIRALSPAVNDPTTAVQALDQIEDLLRRLARRELEAGRAHDATGALRLVFPTPSWEDYLSLAFDEIRQFGNTSVQVMRRMRAALYGIAEVCTDEARRASVERYLAHLTNDVARSAFDDIDRASALSEDPQGLGLPRRRPPAPPPAR